MVMACLLGALVFWLCLSWIMEYYVASTAEDRFRMAIRTGDRIAGCINADIAAEAYQMAQAHEASRRVRGLAGDVCRR